MNVNYISIGLHINVTLDEVIIIFLRQEIIGAIEGKLFLKKLEAMACFTYILPIAVLAWKCHIYIYIRICARVYISIMYFMCKIYTRSFQLAVGSR